METSGKLPWENKTFWEKVMSPSWNNLLESFLLSPHMSALMKTIANTYAIEKTLPKQSQIFRAFKETDYPDLRVVFLGQDPYSKNESANGLAFGIDLDSEAPPTDRILEVLGKDAKTKKDLLNLSKQGILLLNCALTAKANAPGIHVQTWRKFTEHVLTKISENNSGIIFVLIGTHAKSYDYCINEKLHYVIKLDYPTIGYKQNKPWDYQNFFKIINQILLKNNGAEYIINW